MSLIPYRKADLWGYANPDKTIAIKPQFQEADLFSEGFAVVKKGGKYGYINKEGKVVIPFKFYSAKAFRVGYKDLKKDFKPGDGTLNAQKAVLFAGAAPNADGVEICIGTNGIKIPQCPAIPDNSAPDVNKTTTVTVEKNYSTIKKSDLFDKITDDYKMVPGADETYYIAVRNNNYGVFNNKFEVLVPFEYSKIEKMTVGGMTYLMVDKNGMKGVLFGNGSPYMAVDNSRLDYIEAGNGNRYFIFTEDGKTGLKDTKYKMIAAPVYNDISYVEGKGFILTGADNEKGFIFLNNNILEPKYAEVKPLKDGAYLRVKTTDGKFGYISSNNVEFFE